MSSKAKQAVQFIAYHMSSNFIHSHDVTSFEYICTVFRALQFFEYLMESKYYLHSLQSFTVL